MKRRIAATSLLLWILFVTANESYGQEPFKNRSSPLALTQARFKDAYIKVVYSQPHTKGRVIFGDLVPYGEVWRTGANEATELTTTHDVMVNNQILKAGTYSIFTIPQEDKWTIIINRDVGLWGAYNYVAKLDVMRFDVPVQENVPRSEAFTIIFNERNEMADLLILWDNVKISVPFKFIN